MTAAGPSGTAVAVVAAALLTVGCGSDGPEVRAVAIDGGTADVTLTNHARIAARPGDTVRIRHAGSTETSVGDPDGEDLPHAHLVGATHALVSGEPGALPPLFVPRAGGAEPNAAVWGHCRGGQPGPDLDGCPVPSIEGPQRWDGRSYWSTGAMLPGETRDVPLSETLAAGSYTLSCVFHPRLRVTISITNDPGALTADRATTPSGSPLDPADVASPVTTPGEVAAGWATDGTRVNLFHPQQVTVRTGQRVTWTVSSPDPHDVVLGVEEPPELVDTPPSDALPAAPDGPWDGRSPVRSGFLSTDPSAPGGSSFSLTFDTPGTYRYHCRFHPVMTGTVTVTGT